MDAGIVLGVGDPAECIAWIPDCGCDACDSGSANELDYLDVYMNGIITGAFRRVTDGSRTITVIGDDVRTTSGFEPRSQDEVEAALADPTGWNELSGASWLDVLGPVMSHRPSANDGHPPRTHASANANENGWWRSARRV